MTRFFATLSPRPFFGQRLNNALSVVAVVCGGGFFVAYYLDCQECHGARDSVWFVREQLRLLADDMWAHPGRHERRALFNRERFFRRLGRCKNLSRKQEDWRQCTILDGSAASSSSSSSSSTFSAKRENKSNTESVVSLPLICFASQESDHCKKIPKSREERILMNTKMNRHPYLLSSSSNVLAALDEMQQRRRAVERYLPIYTLALWYRAWFVEWAPVSLLCRFDERAQESCIVAYEHLAAKVAAQMFSLKGESAYAYAPPPKKNDDDNNIDNDDDDEVSQQMFAFDGFSRLKSTIIVREFFRSSSSSPAAQSSSSSSASDVQHRMQCIDNTLSRALLFNEMIIGNSWKERESSSSSDHSKKEKRMNYFKATWRDHWPAVRDSCQRLALDAIKARLDNGECIPLITGTTTHSISVMLAPNYIVVSNSGSGSNGRFGVSVYTLDRRKLLEGNNPFLKQLLLGHLKREQMKLPKDTSSSSSSATATATTVAATAIPPWLEGLGVSGHVGTLKLRKQIAGNCSFESCSNPLVLMGLALSSSQDAVTSSGNLPSPVKNITLRAPEDGAAFLMALQQAAPLYFHLVDQLLFKRGLVDLVQTRCVTKNKSNDDLILRIVASAASRPINLRPAECEQVVSALLQTPLLHAVNKRDEFLGQLLHIAAQCGDVTSIERIKALEKTDSSNSSGVLAYKHDHLLSLRESPLRSTKAHLTAVEAAKMVLESKKPLFMFGYSPIPSRDDLLRGISALSVDVE